MKRNSKAYTLIKNLTMSEKRYFKIFSERHTIGEQNKYVVLFDVLDVLTEEDDQVVKKELRKHKIKTDYLSADKNYLYHLILRSLINFHDARTFNLQLKELLMSIEILFHKGMYYECLKLIEYTEEIASECENFQLMIDVLMWKKKCSGYSLGLQKASEINKEIDSYLILLNNYKRLTDLYYESNLLQANFEKYSKKEIIKQFESLLAVQELKNEKNALSFTAKIFYHLVHSNYYFAKDDKINELKHLQSLIDITKTSTTYGKENPLDFISLINRLLGIKKYFDKKSFFEDITYLNEFGKNNFIKQEVMLERIFIHSTTHEIDYYLIHSDYSAALNKIKEVEKHIAKYQIAIEPYHYIYYYYLHAITLIFSDQYNKALKYVNLALNNFKMMDRPQVYLRIELLNALIHYELKNYALVNSVGGKILRQNKKTSHLISIEESLIKTLMNLSSYTGLNIKAEKKQFTDWLQETEQFKDKHGSAVNSLINNYVKWVSSKIKRQTVTELFGKVN